MSKTKPTMLRALMSLPRTKARGPVKRGDTFPAADAQEVRDLVQAGRAEPEKAQPAKGAAAE